MSLATQNRFYTQGTAPWHARELCLQFELVKTGCRCKAKSTLPLQTFRSASSFFLPSWSTAVSSSEPGLRQEMCFGFCMAAGLHRNPDLLRKPTSALDKEMRRRVWSAISEFELQISFWRGMISTPWPQQSDCVPPINIQDEDLTESSEHLPHPRPASECTTVSYLTMTNETFMLRYNVNTVLNSIRRTFSFDKARRYTEEIEAHLQAMPTWIRQSSETPRALLSITLRQYLLVLHDRQMRNGGIRL